MAAPWPTGSRAAAKIPTILGDVQFDARGDLVTQHFAWYRWSAAQFALDPQQ